MPSFFMRIKQALKVTYLISHLAITTLFYFSFFDKVLGQDELACKILEGWLM